MISSFISIADFDFCSEDGVLRTFQIVGYLLIIIKILVPLLLLVFGSIDMGQAVLSSDDKAISKAASSLVTRAIAGIIIFFIPTIINFTTSLIGSWSAVETEFNNCRVCMFETKKCDNTRRGACNNSCKAKEYLSGKKKKKYSSGVLEDDICICKK